MRQILLVLECEPGLVPLLQACSAAKTHPEAVASISTHVKQLVSDGDIPEDVASDFVRQIKKKKTQFNGWLITKRGVIRGYSWGEQAYLSTLDAKENLKCRLDMVPTAYVEGP